MNVLFSPHNDDAELFAAHVCLRARPLVVVCLRSAFQESLGVTYAQREAETSAAMRILGCEWRQEPYLDVRPDWEIMEAGMRRFDAAFSPGCVWAPAYDFAANGHEPGYDVDRPLSGILHHDMIGLMVEQVFGEDRVCFYQTYTRYDGRVMEGDPVYLSDEEVELKLAALACYRSQIRLDSTGHHFDSDLANPEWVK